MYINAVGSALLLATFMMKALAAPSVDSGTIYDAAAVAMREMDRAKEFSELGRAHNPFLARFHNQIRDVKPSWYDKDVVTRAAGDKAREVLEDAAVDRLPTDLKKAVQAMGNSWAGRVTLGLLETENVASNWRELQLLNEQVWNSYRKNFRRLLEEKGLLRTYEEKMGQVLPKLESLNFDAQNSSQSWLRKP